MTSHSLGGPDKEEHADVDEDDDKEDQEITK
jgi:hypothetical protein